MIILNSEEREPKLDLKAGRQIFSKEYTRQDKRSVSIDKDATNPIDTKLRQMCIASFDGQIDVKGEFVNRNVAVIVGGLRDLRIVKGKLKDVYLADRMIRMKTRKGEDVIADFDKVIELQDTEI